MLWLKATGKVILTGFFELIVAVVMTLIVCAACGAVILLGWLLFQVVFWIFGDAWFYALGNWFANGGVNVVLWALVGCLGVCLMVLFGVEVKNVKDKMEAEQNAVAESDDELYETGD